MNAILTFPAAVAVELTLLRRVVEQQQQAVDAGVYAFEMARTRWESRETEIDRRMQILQQRLARLSI